MSDQKYDYILVGQGIAGTALAWHLIQAGKRVLVVNDSTRPSASLVAAGIYNPLTGRKLVKTWMADTIFPYAINFYSASGYPAQTVRAPTSHISPLPYAGRAKKLFDARIRGRYFGVY